MFRFAALHNIRTAVEVAPMDHVNGAMDRVRGKKARYRMVLAAQPIGLRRGGAQPTRKRRLPARHQLRACLRLCLPILAHIVPPMVAMKCRPCRVESGAGRCLHQRFCGGPAIPVSGEKGGCPESRSYTCAMMFGRNRTARAETGLSWPYDCLSISGESPKKCG
jgi:hypothetical protein